MLYEEQNTVHYMQNQRNLLKINIITGTYKEIIILAITNKYNSDTLEDMMFRPGNVIDIAREEEVTMKEQTRTVNWLSCGMKQLPFVSSEGWSMAEDLSVRWGASSRMKKQGKCAHNCSEPEVGWVLEAEGED